jgi:hypothetical protein
MRKITKRDVFVFFLGVVFCLILNIIVDWEKHVKAFKDGFKAGMKSTKVENTN